MIPRPEQQVKSDLGLNILRENGIVYYAMEERTGKTITALLTVEKSKAERCLIITKKKALDGWNETLASLDTTKHYTVTNYHQAHKQPGYNFDVVILDESHNYISSFPKPGKIWKELKPICFNKPIIYVSATPHAQGPQMLYHQFALSAYSPWYKHTDFYKWFQMYGYPYTKEINRIKVPQYDRCNAELIKGCVEHLFVTGTRAELGFEHEPEDQRHYIELASNTKAVYNKIVNDQYVKLSVGELVCDSVSKLRTSLHQLEGGTMRIDNKPHVLSNTEKVDYILAKFGDTEELVIMYNFQAEANKLAKYFKKAAILQATSFAEGVDLHKYKHLVIYSQDYSTARHSQRRARQCNKLRDEPIIVHYILVKKAISHQVYKTVSLNKKNYVDSVYEGAML